MPIRSLNYKNGSFRKVDEILPDQVIDGPVWCAVKAEGRRRKKTIFGTCPGCLKINRLDGRQVHEDYNGRICFKNNGCFICPHCYVPFWPTLTGWTPDVRDLPKKRKKLGGKDVHHKGPTAGPTSEAQEGGLNPGSGSGQTAQ